MDRLTDVEIDRLLREAKPLPLDYVSELALRPKRGHREQELSVIGREGHNFRIILRQSLLNPVELSVILAVIPQSSTSAFRLRRYNGRSHEHTNRIERDRFYDFHVHIATERYQEAGLDPDGYAEPSSRFGDLHAAVDCLIQDCGFELQQGAQLGLFDLDN